MKARRFCRWWSYFVGHRRIHRERKRRRAAPDSSGVPSVLPPENSGLSPLPDWLGVFTRTFARLWFVQIRLAAWSIARLYGRTTALKVYRPVMPMSGRVVAELSFCAVL